MSFIAKNPLTMPEIKYTPSTPSGTRGIFAKEDGWYEVDSNGKVYKLATLDDVKGCDWLQEDDTKADFIKNKPFKYLGGVDLNQILPAGMYSIDYFESSGTPEIDSIDIEMPYCTLITSPPKLIDGGWEVVHQLLFIHDTVTTKSYLFQRIIERSSQGELGACDWTMISTSENGGTVNPGDIDLSDYYTKEEIDKIHNDGIVTLKKNISFTVGENIITNDTPVILSNGWTKGSSGEYIHNSKLTNPLEVQINAAEGAIYYVEWDLDFDKATSQSSASVAIGDSYSQDTYFGKNHIEMIVKCEGGGSLYITPLDSFNGSIANISCKPLTDGDGLVITQEFNGIYMDDVNADNYGRWNVILSDNAMLDTVNSTRSIAIGHSALNGCKGGNRNIAIGTFSMGKMSGGERNVSIGSDSMLEVKAATDNVSIGVGAMYYGANPTNNIAIGKDALQGHVDFENHQVNDSTIVGNVAIGYQAGLHTKANKAPQGSRNVFVGNQSGYANTTGYNNVGVGAGALQGNKTGHSNTCIGVNATVTDGKTKSIAIGYGSKATKSNQAVIGNSGVTETVLYGDLIVYGTDAVGRNVATEDYVDAKIAEIPTGGGGGSSDVDLSGYYTSEEVDEKLQSKVDEREGYGLSNAVNVYIEGSVDSTFYKPTHTIRIDTYEVDESGSLSQEVSVYDTDTVNELIDTRLGISVIEDLSATEDILMLENGQEAYLGTVESITMRMPDMYNRFDYHQSYFTFEIGDIEDMSTFSITCLFEDSGEKVDIVWVGDDCNAEGVFTPQANTRYEIHIKCMSIPYPNATWVARVGAY